MKKILAPLLTLLALFGSFGAFAQSGDPLALLKEVQTKTLALKDQNIQFAMVIEAPGRDGKKVQRKTSGQVQVVGEKALLVLNGQKNLSRRQPSDHRERGR
jgi:hypothetical protein